MPKTTIKHTSKTVIAAQRLSNRLLLKRFKAAESVVKQQVLAVADRGRDLTDELRHVKSKLQTVAKKSRSRSKSVSVLTSAQKRKAKKIQKKQMTALKKTKQAVQNASRQAELFRLQALQLNDPNLDADKKYRILQDMDRTIDRGRSWTSRAMDYIIPVVVTAASVAGAGAVIFDYLKPVIDSTGTAVTTSLNASAAAATAATPLGRIIACGFLGVSALRHQGYTGAALATGLCGLQALF